MTVDLVLQPVAVEPEYGDHEGEQSDHQTSPQQQRLFRRQTGFDMEDQGVIPDAPTPVSELLRMLRAYSLQRSVEFNGTDDLRP